MPANDLTILHLSRCFTLFLTPFYRANICVTSIYVQDVHTYNRSVTNIDVQDVHKYNRSVTNIDV